MGKSLKKVKSISKRLGKEFRKSPLGKAARTPIRLRRI